MKAQPSMLCQWSSYKHEKKNLRPIEAKVLCIGQSICDLYFFALQEGHCMHASVSFHLKFAVAVCTQALLSVKRF